MNVQQPFRMSLLTIVLFAKTQLWAASPSAVLLPKPQKSFALAWGDMTLVLPAVMRDQIKIRASSEGTIDLDGGTIDVRWRAYDATSETMVVHDSWIEMEGQQRRCSPSQEIELYRQQQKRRLSSDIVYRLEKISNPSFQGYRIYGENLRGSDRDFMTYALIDEQKELCHTISLALVDFKGANPWQMRKLLAPLSEQIERSINYYIY